MAIIKDLLGMGEGRQCVEQTLAALFTVPCGKQALEG